MIVLHLARHNAQQSLYFYFIIINIYCPLADIYAATVPRVVCTFSFPIPVDNWWQPFLSRVGVIHVMICANESFRLIIEMYKRRSTRFSKYNCSLWCCLTLLLLLPQTWIIYWEKILIHWMVYEWAALLHVGLSLVLLGSLSYDTLFIYPFTQFSHTTAARLA
jgi:hypothetical protein